MIDDALARRVGGLVARQIVQGIHRADGRMKWVDQDWEVARTVYHAVHTYLTDPAHAGEDILMGVSNAIAAVKSPHISREFHLGLLAGIADAMDAANSPPLLQ